MVSLSHEFLLFSDGEILEEGKKIYAKLLPDTKVPQWHYRCRSYDMGYPTEGFPQMVPFNPRVGTPLTGKWQWFLMNQQINFLFGLENFDQLDADQKYNWRLLSRDQKDRLIKWYGSMFDDHRFLTNGKGVNNCFNAITGEREGGQLPIEWEVSCAVNTVELLSTKRIMTQDSEWYEMKTLTGENSPPSLRDVNFIKTPQFIHTAVTWMYSDKTRTFRTGDFPQMYNAFGYTKHSIYPVISPTGKVMVETSRVELLSPGQIVTNPFEI